MKTSPDMWLLLQILPPNEPYSEAALIGIELKSMRYLLKFLIIIIGQIVLLT